MLQVSHIPALFDWIQVWRQARPLKIIEVIVIFIKKQFEISFALQYGANMVHAGKSSRR